MRKVIGSQLKFLKENAELISLLMRSMHRDYANDLKQFKECLLLDVKDTLL